MERFLLSNNNLKLNGIIQIAQSLRNTTGLKAINFQGNAVTEGAAEVLASIISNNIGLEELYLGNNQLQIGVPKIAKAIKNISTLKKLDLYDTGICNDDAVLELAAAISSNNSIEKLCLSNNCLGPSITAILKAFSNICGLKVLALNNTNISNIVVDDLAEVLKANSSLQYLFLSDNDLQSSGFIILSKEIKSLKFLTSFSAYNINVTSSVSEKLISIIENNSLLTKVSLGNNMLEMIYYRLQHAVVD